MTTTHTFDGVAYHFVDTGYGLSRRLQNAIDDLSGMWVTIEFDAAESRKAGMRSLSQLHKAGVIDIRQTCYGRDLAERAVECRATAHGPSFSALADANTVILVALR
jgi:hypothetical protein